MKVLFFIISSLIPLSAIGQPKASGVAQPVSKAVPAAASAPTTPVTSSKPASTTSNANVVTAASPNAPAKAVPVSANTSTGDSAVESILNEDLIKALRDPFQPPLNLLAKKEAPKTDLEIFPLKDFKLNGVVTGPKKTRAMITTPNNKVFFIKVGDSMGVRDGKVTQILSDSIKILEYFTDQNGKRVPDIYQLTISGELISLSKKEEE